MTNEQLQFCLNLIKKQLINEVNKVDDCLDSFERKTEFKYIGKDKITGILSYACASDERKKASGDFEEVEKTTYLLDPLYELINNLELPTIET